MGVKITLAEQPEKELKTNFQELLNHARGVTLLEDRQTQKGTPYTKTKGYHFYGHLDLALRLSAAEDDGPAKQYLNILQSFTTVAERAGKEFGMVIFEVQGERIHLFLETDDGLEKKQDIINFARAWNASVNAIVKPKAGDAFKSFSMAADFGSTLILLSSGEDESESIISLGNAANRPAKHLSRWEGVRNGHLKLNAAALEVGGEDKEARWEDHDVSEFKLADSQVLLNRITESIDLKIDAYLEISAKEVVPVEDVPVEMPIKKQGFAFRADYDGFSKKVQAAMADTDQAQQALVDEFDQIMKDLPQKFADDIKGTVTVFPWAGDCANLFIEADIDYETARTFIPATAAHTWHKKARSFKSGRSSQGASKWVVGILGGDDGATLVARVYTEHRTFAVAAGWGWGRSIDAYQSNGLAAEETVTTVEDRSALDDPYAAPFRELDSRFQKATFDGLERAINGVAKKESPSEPMPFFIGSKKEELPAQRPHFHE